MRNISLIHGDTCNVYVWRIAFDKVIDPGMNWVNGKEYP